MAGNIFQISRNIAHGFTPVVKKDLSYYANKPIGVFKNIILFPTRWLKILFFYLIPIRLHRLIIYNNKQYHHRANSLKIKRVLSATRIYLPFIHNPYHVGSWLHEAFTKLRTPLAILLHFTRVAPLSNIISLPTNNRRRVFHPPYLQTTA